MRRLTPAWLVMLAGAVLAVSDYQAGLPPMLTDMRSAAMVAVAVWAASRAVRAVASGRQDRTTASARPAPTSLSR